MLLVCPNLFCPFTGIHCHIHPCIYIHPFALGIWHDKFAQISGLAGSFSSLQASQVRQGGDADKVIHALLGAQLSAPGNCRMLGSHSAEAHFSMARYLKQASWLTGSRCCW